MTDNNLFTKTIKKGVEKFAIRTHEAFVFGLEGKLPSTSKSFKDIIDSIDSHLKAENPKVEQGALNRVHGDWYEFLVAISAWQYHVDHPDSFVALPLPKLPFVVGSLYEERLHDYIEDLRLKLRESANVELITSNPDFVIIDTRELFEPDIFKQPLEKISTKAVSALSKHHEQFRHKCKFESIKGYAGVKWSLRADRRLQLPHEGSLMKALYLHLQTRLWIIDPPGIRYYGLTREPGEEDYKAMSTVATHSITTVLGEPEPAVDKLFKVDSIDGAYEAFKIMLSQNPPSNPVPVKGG